MKVVSGNVSSVETHSTGKTTWPSILPLSMKGRCIYYVILAKDKLVILVWIQISLTHVSVIYRIRPYECEICGHRFSQKHHVAQHVQSKHEHDEDRQKPLACEVSRDR